MRIVYKRASNFSESNRPACWIALKDNKGMYHSWLDESLVSDNIILAGDLIYADTEKQRFTDMLLKEGHTR